MVAEVEGASSWGEEDGGRSSAQVIGHGRCGGALQKAADGDSGDSRIGAGSQAERRQMAAGA
jgi:hypothetical protein